MNPHGRFSSRGGVVHDLRRPTLAAGRQAVPQCEQHVAALHDVATGLGVPVLRTRQRAWLDDCHGVLEQLVEFVD